MPVRALFLAALLPTVALADWGDSFTQPKLQALLGGKDFKVLVAGAGEPADEVTRAAEALRTRLRESGLPSLVMDTAALGPLNADSDEAVRKKAATLPWDKLLIVRVFPGPKDASPTAVVTISEPGGTTQRSLVVTRDLPVAPPPVVTPQEPPPPPRPVSPPPPPPRDPRELHFGQAIARTREELVDKGVYLGTRQVRGLELYQLLARPEFLARAEARMKLKRTLGITGGAAGAVSIAGFIATAATKCTRRQGTSTGTCLQTELPSLVIPSAIVGGIGVGLIVTALVLSAEPVSAAELLPAIDQYNAPFKKVTLRLEPSVTLDGAGLALSGSF